MRLGLIMILAVGVTGPAAGCAAVTVDEDGSRRIVGFVAMRLAPAADATTIAGQVTDVSALGLALYSSPIQQALVLGYSRERLAAVRDHALVLGNPLTALHNEPLGAPAGQAAEEPR